MVDRAKLDFEITKKTFTDCPPSKLHKTGVCLMKETRNNIFMMDKTTISGFFFFRRTKDDVTLCVKITIHHRGGMKSHQGGIPALVLEFPGLSVIP